MTTFIENLIQNELPTQGFKPFVSQRELLREEKEKKGANNFRPTFRGFYSHNWAHGHSLKSTGQGFSVEFTDRIRFGQFSLRPQIILQNGTKALYRASLGVNLGTYGELEFTQQAKNAIVNDQYQITHYSNMNGLNTKTSVTFDGPQHTPVLNLSSLYNQTIEVFDRQTKMLTKNTTIYGQDASFSIMPFQQRNYSLYYQSKAPNLDLIAAYLRREVADRIYSNNVIGGFKYVTKDNKKILAKVSYSLEERKPHLDLMIRNSHNSDKKIKTFHKISSDFKVGSGVMMTLNKFRLNALVEVSFLNSGFNTQPFNLSLRLETNGEKRATSGNRFFGLF